MTKRPSKRDREAEARMNRGRPPRPRHAGDDEQLTAAEQYALGRSS